MLLSGWVIAFPLPSGRSVRADLYWLICHSCPFWLSCLSCPVLPVMFWPSCPLGFVLVRLSRLICQLDLSWLTCSGCPVLDVLSWLSPSWISCQIYSFFLYWLSCPSWPVLSFLIVLLYLYCHACPATVLLSQQSSPACLHHLSCHAACLSTFVSQFPCPRCPVHAVMFWLSCLSVLSQLFCPGCLAGVTLLSCAWHPVLSVCPVWLAQTDFLANPSRLICPSCRVLTSCPGCPVLAPVVLSRPCRCCHVLVNLFSLSLSRLTWSGWPFRPTCPDWPVLVIPSELSCPSCCPVLAVLSLQT